MWRIACLGAGMEKRFVYVLKSTIGSTRYYTGLTSNPPERLRQHNAGKCDATARLGPWHLDVVIEFSDERRAVAFERYLKTGSGYAFAARHLR